MVCLGNICRSPLAEGILRMKSIKFKIDIQIDSAGTSNYHIGQHPDRRTISNALSHGVDVSQLKARQFIVSDFDDFDHIYVMDHSNYSDVIALARTEVDKKKVTLILNCIYPNSNMSVPDPYFGGEQGFEKVFILLDNACEAIAEALKRTS